MNTLSDISPGEFLIWLAFFICIALACYWPDRSKYEP